MQHLDRLITIKPYMSRTEIERRFRCRSSAGGTTPLQARLSGDERSDLLVEFDDKAEVVFGELAMKCAGYDKALGLFRQMEAQLVRADAVRRGGSRPPPVRRSAVPMHQLLAWNRWTLDDRRSLQVIVGAFSPSGTGSEQVRLAASVHIDADHHG